VSSRIEAVLPFWLDRPDEEAVDIAQAARRAGLTGLWIGEMASFDAFALATAIGIRTPALRLKLGPLPIGVRTPAAIALGASSVAALTGCDIDIALGASSPVIVTGWHDRGWAHSVGRMRETIECLRPVMRGERADYAGRYVRSHGFRLRHPLPHSGIGIGAFGPAMTRLAVEIADEVVLNLATPQRVALVRRQIDDHAAAAGNRTPPRLTVWSPAAMRPGEAALRQVANQLATPDCSPTSMPAPTPSRWYRSPPKTPQAEPSWNASPTPGDAFRPPRRALHDTREHPMPVGRTPDRTAQYH